MTLVDWRTRTAAEMAACYVAERRAWRERFDWETQDNWQQVEHARTAGSLPGLVLLDDGSRQVGRSS